MCLTTLTILQEVVKRVIRVTGIYKATNNVLLYFWQGTYVSEECERFFFLFFFLHELIVNYILLKEIQRLNKLLQKYVFMSVFAHVKISGLL